MHVFLLLDQDTSTLKVYPLAGKGNRPVEVVSLGNVPMEVEKSFYGAALATYNLLMKSGAQISHYIFAYELEESVGRRIYGGSGALAFAIASMCGMLGRESKEVIGATGVVDIERGTIGKVGSINEKLSLVIRNSRDLTKIFYPMENDCEIHPTLRKEGFKKGIELMPVQTLTEVYLALWGGHRTDRVVCKYFRKRPGWIALVVSFFALLIVYGSFSHLFAIYLIEYEHYTVARMHLAFARRIAFYNKNVDRIFNDYKSSIETLTMINIRYSSGKEESYPTNRVPPELRLTERDSFAFRIESYKPLFVYILQADDSGVLKRLYPAQNQTGITQGGASIPGTGVFFRPQGKAGNRDIFIVLSKWRCRWIEEATSNHRGYLRPVDMHKYDLDEQSVQLERIPMSLTR
jgi:hypothetical protein